MTIGCLLFGAHFPGNAQGLKGLKVGGKKSAECETPFARVCTSSRLGAPVSSESSHEEAAKKERGSKQ